MVMTDGTYLQTPNDIVLTSLDDDEYYLLLDRSACLIEQQQSRIKSSGP